MSKRLVLSRLQNTCVRREYCCGQIRKKLKRQIELQKITQQEAELILQELVNDRFIDDSRYSAAFVRDKYRLAGWGRRKIEFYLKREGVASNVINSALLENYPMGSVEGRDILVKVMQRKWNSLKADEETRKKREKVIRFALNRGFEYGEIVAIFNKLWSKNL